MHKREIRILCAKEEEIYLNGQRHMRLRFYCFFFFLPLTFTSDDMFNNLVQEL